MLKLLPRIKVGSGWVQPNSEYRLHNHRVSHTTSDIEIYSASVDDRDTIFCFLDPQVIAPPAFMKLYPDTEVRLLLLAKLASEYP